MSKPFENVREQLLKAGIAAGHVNRYVLELREHLADLTNRERTSGNGDAAIRARTLMGSDAQLVQAMLDRSPPRALAVKAPWAVFGLLPVVALFVITWLIVTMMMRLTLATRYVLPTDMPGSIQALMAAVVIFTGYLLGPLAAAGCIAIALRQRLSSAWIWVGLVLIALFTGLFAFHISTGPGDPYRAANVVVTNRHLDVTATLTLILLRAAILFALAALAYRTLKARQAGAA